ncbi:MAG: hypothetical protein V4727_07085 [Verrucomicrobiota bacterium]
MSKIEEIEEAVERLSSHELISFRTWFDKFDAARWDVSIDQDIADQKLDSLAEEALSEYRAGGTRQL